MNIHMPGSDRASSESTTHIGTGTVPPRFDHDDSDIPSSTTHCTTHDQIEDRRKLEEWADRLQLGVSDVEAFCRNGFDYEKIPPANTPSRVPCCRI